MNSYCHACMQGGTAPPELVKTLKHRAKFNKDGAPKKFAKNAIRAYAYQLDLWLCLDCIDKIHEDIND